MAWGIFKNLFQRIKVVATKLEVFLQNNEWWIASYIFEWNGNRSNNSLFFYLKNLNNSLERKIVSKEDADYCKTKIEPWHSLLANKLTLNNCKINIYSRAHDLSYILQPYLHPIPYKTIIFFNKLFITTWRKFWK